MVFSARVKLDFREFPDGYVVTAADVEAELKRIGHTLAPLEIVVVNTAAGGAYGQDNFVSKGCGMGYEATMFLLEQGIRVTGTDAWSWDAPFDQTAARYAESGDASLIWEGHKAGAILATAISKSCTTLRPCPLAALPSAAFRTKFGARLRAGPGRWRS